MENGCPRPSALHPHLHARPIRQVAIGQPDNPPVDDSFKFPVELCGRGVRAQGACVPPAHTLVHGRIRQAVSFLTLYSPRTCFTSNSESLITFNARGPRSTAYSSAAISP